MRERKILNGNFDRDLTKIIPTSLEAENIAKEVERRTLLKVIAIYFELDPCKTFLAKVFKSV